MKNPSINLTPKQYTTIKPLFNAASKDKTSRIALTFVYYNPEIKEVVATDGHILRVEAIDLGKKAIYFAKEDFKSVSGRNDITVQNEYDTEYESKYPEYERVIPDRDYKEWPDKHPYLCVSFDLLAQFAKSDSNKIKSYVLIQTKKLGSVKIFTAYTPDGYDAPRFLGVVMPIRARNKPEAI